MCICNEKAICFEVKVPVSWCVLFLISVHVDIMFIFPDMMAFVVIVEVAELAVMLAVRVILSRY